MNMGCTAERLGVVGRVCVLDTHMHCHQALAMSPTV
jgi:hypothetical protein